MLAARRFRSGRERTQVSHIPQADRLISAGRGKCLAPSSNRTAIATAAASTDLRGASADAARTRRHRSRDAD